MLVALALNLLSLHHVFAQNRGHVLGMSDCGLDAGRVQAAVLVKSLSDLVLGG